MSISPVKNPQTPVVSPKPTTGNAPSNATSSAAAGAAQATSSTQKAAANGYAKAAVAPTVLDAANVQISPRAKELNLARAVVENTPDVREDKVAFFRKAIESGEYKADAGKIADGILNEAIRDELAKDPQNLPL
jgi:negative regulator of flagellin synthesis FlgM